MKSQIFIYGGGAGVGSYVIVLNNGSLQEPNAEKIRWAYDSGENLYLSIIDDSTSEALLPLTGYVDNENVLHLIGRDFDDNKTYEFAIDNTTQSVEATEIDGVTLGDGIISTEGGGSGTEVIPNPEIAPGEQLEELNSIQIGNNKYTISGGGGSGEAEPIISINMTNMDVTGIDATETRKIRDLQFYCTKERWDNFVALSKQQFQLDVTYDNFGSLFMTLDVEQQATALGYLLMDYYNGKILPEAYLQQNSNIQETSAKGKCGISDITTYTFPQMQIEIVMNCAFSGTTSSSFGGAIPSPDTININYYTADTVITVKEIAGPAIGSGGSGTSTVDSQVYEIVIGGLVGGLRKLKFFLYGTNVDNFVTRINNVISSVNTQISAGISALSSIEDLATLWETYKTVTTVTPAGSKMNVGVMSSILDALNETYSSAISLYTPDASFTIPLKIVATAFQNYSVYDIGDLQEAILDSDDEAESGLTITVNKISKEQTISGGSDSSASANQYDYIQLCFNSSNNSHIVLMFDKHYSRADDVAPTVNQLITTLNQMGSLSIPTYTDLEDLAGIADYLNALDTNNYAQIKVIFWASLLGYFPYLSLNIKGYDNGAVTPTFVEGVADLNNQNFAYTIKMMDNTGQMNNVATEQTIFDFDVFVNQLD